MAVVFLLVFTLPYSLAEHGDNPKQTIASIGERSFGTAALYLGGYAVLFGLYGLGYWLVCRRAALSSWPRWQKWLLILGFGLVFNLVLMPMYPADSTDIYGYIIRGRMSSVHGLNPMVDVPSQIPDDPFYEFASWRSVTSPYGPAWEALTALTSSIAGDGYLSNVIAFKTVAVLGFLITAIAVGLSLEKWAPGRVAVGLLLYAWNPLVICKTGGAGHNDAVMTAWLLVSIALLLRERYLLATLAAVVGALVKFIPLMVVPVIAVLAIRKLQGRRRWGYLLQAAIFGLLIVVLFHLPFGKGLDLSYFMGGGRMYTATPVTVGRQLLIPLLDGVDWGNRIHATPVSNTAVIIASACIFGLYVLLQLRKVYRRPSPYFAVHTAAKILLFFLLVAAFQFLPWYVLWVIPLAAVLDDSPLRRSILLFSYTATFQLFAFSFITLRPEGWMDIPWRDLIPIALVMGPVWGYAGWIWISRRFKKRAPPGRALAA